MKITKLITKTVLVAFVAVFAIGCSDGQHSAAPALMTPSVSPDISFTIAKVGGEAKGSASATINKGDAVVLEWSVSVPGEKTEAAAGGLTPKADEAGAEEAKAVPNPFQITLDAPALKLHKENLKAKDKMEIPNIEATTEFKLTVVSATGKPETRKVTAMVKDQQVEVIFGETLPESIVAGESVDLCWEISASEGAITILFGEGGETLVEATPFSAVPAEEGSEETTVFAPSDCITVTPVETTTYYMSVSVADAANVQKEATVTVERKLEIISFTATPEKIAGQEEVTVAWEVVPAGAIVTLEVGETAISELAVIGSQAVPLSETTTLTLNVSYAGQEESKKITVELVDRVVQIIPEVNGRTVDGAASASVGTFFEGEEVTVGWNASAEGVDSGNIRVSISGSEETYGATGEVTVPVTAEGISITASGEGVDTNTQQLNVGVRKWSASSGLEGRVVRSVTPVRGASDSVLVGFAGDLKEGEMEIAQVTAGATTIKKINYKDIFLKAGSLAKNKNPKFIEDINTFPVNAIAVDDQDRYFVGTSGGIVYSDDMGTTWKELNLTAHLYNDGSYTGSHRSCKGDIQEGRKGPKGTIVGLAQVCDIVIDTDGKLYAAFDNMVIFLENGADAYIADTAKKTPENLWKGLPKPGEKGNDVFGKINHDLDILHTTDGKKIIYSATDSGVYSSIDGGYNWNAVAEGGATFAIAADEIYGKIYFGGEDGLSVANYDGTEKTKVAGVSGPVYSIDVDPVEIGTVYVGTAGGVFVTRDGSKWVNVSTGAMAGSGAARAVAVTKVGDTVGIFAGVETGVFGSVASVDASGIAVPDPVVIDLPDAPAATDGEKTEGGDEPKEGEEGEDEGMAASVAMENML